MSEKMYVLFFSRTDRTVCNNEVSVSGSDLACEVCVCVLARSNSKQRTKFHGNACYAGWVGLYTGTSQVTDNDGRARGTYTPGWWSTYLWFLLSFTSIRGWSRVSGWVRSIYITVHYHIYLGMYIFFFFGVDARVTCSFWTVSELSNRDKVAKQSCWAFSRPDRAGLGRGRAANYLYTLCNLSQQTFFLRSWSLFYLCSSSKWTSIFKQGRRGRCINIQAQPCLLQPRHNTLWTMLHLLERCVLKRKCCTVPNPPSRERWRLVHLRKP